MNPLNSILLEGNLTKDPKYNVTKNGTPVCTFRVASNRFYKKNGENQDEVSFFEVETWSRLADTCNEYLKKGRGVRVVGRLKQDRWMDTDGKSQTKVKIVAEHVEFRPDFKGRKDEDDETIDNSDFNDESDQIEGSEEIDTISEEVMEEKAS